MNINKVLLLCFSIFFYACDGDDPGPKGAYEQGILVLNEGGFGAGNSSLSFINPEDSILQNVFTSANDGLGLGDVAQSMIATNDLILVVVNNSNVLYALNKTDLTISYSIETLSLPRFVTFKGDYGYVTEWVSFSEPGRLTKFELANGAIIQSVSLGYGAEFPIFIENEIYVTNNFESTISIVDPNAMSVSGGLNTGPAPGEIIATEDGSYWVICAGGYDENFAPANDGSIQKIESGSIVSTIPMSQNISGKADAKDNSIFVFSGNTVWEVVPELVQINEFLSDDQVISFYSINFDNDGELYMTDSKGFQSAGEVIHYSPSGSRENTFTVGIGPNDLIFR